MSLQTDSVFIMALQADADIRAAVGGRIYGQAIPLPDEEADNVPLPYIIVSFDGLVNDQRTKDDDLEGQEDRVTISVTVCAPSNESLHGLAGDIRVQLREYLTTPDEDDPDYGEFPLDYELTAGPMTYDPLKPSFWQKLTYVCSTNR